MSFINQYISSTHTLFYSEEFFEGGIPYIYSIGNNENTTVVLKTDKRGNVVWQKEYYPGNLEIGFVFKKIIQIKNGNLISYVLYCNGYNKHFVISIDGEGAINYINQLLIESPYGDGFLVKSKINTDYYFAYSGFYGEGYGSNEFGQIIVMKFAENGTVTNQTYLHTGSASDLIIRNVISHQNGITVLADHKAGKSHIIEFDYYSLNVIVHKEIYVGETENSDFISQDIAVVKTSYNEPETNKYIVSGINVVEDVAWIVAVDLAGDSYSYEMPNSDSSGITNLCYFENVLFVSVANNMDTLLHKFNISLFSDIKLIWSQHLLSEKDRYNVSRMVYNYTSSFITSISTDASLLIYSNADFKTCISEFVDLELAEPSGIGIDVGSTHLTGINITINGVEGHNKAVTPDSTFLCKEKAFVDLSESTSLQSSDFYIQAAGSTGNDSTKGFHLRWALKGALSLHLPKGNYASTTANFNKADDFVKIYRAPYVDLSVALKLSEIPNLVLDSQRKWVYIVDGNTFYVHFKSSVKYQNVRLDYNPNEDPIGFIEAYGSELIEIESKSKLSFSLLAKFDSLSVNSSVKLELLSVEKNTISAAKFVSLRQTLTPDELANTKLVSENIRSIRFSAADAVLTKLNFEFYYNFIDDCNANEKWSELGQYALTKDTTVAFDRLEPEPELVHGKWLRYNDEAYVNVENYKAKWGLNENHEQDKIAFVVDKYIELSDLATNPTATESFLFTDPTAQPIDGFTPDPDYNPSDPATSPQFEISNLQLLQISSLDYHVARMLGLGMLDYSEDLFEEEYIYLAEYLTFADLGDGLGAREVRHVYCSLPTTIEDERLPLPIEIKEIKYGVYYGNGTEAPQLLTDPQGYTHDGRTRFLSLFHEPLHEEPANTNFRQSDYQFVSSAQTDPVYAGIEYKLQGSPDWRKPELPYDNTYHNIDATVSWDLTNETVPILIPEEGNPLFIHREKQAGTHLYSSYGINWFSRVTSSIVDWPITTNFPVVNTLKPPTNINALLIRKESPLFLSSAYEQQRLNAIVDDDKTLVRMTFDYNHTQEMIDYQKTINGEIINGYYELNDNDEVFANEIEVFFRNEVPNVISGKIILVSQDPSNELLSIVKTGPYTFVSGPVEPIIPAIPDGLSNNFIGSIMVIDEKEFVVHQITLGSNGYPEFKVFKSAANGAQAGFSDVPVEELEAPQNNTLFIMVENMLSEASWSSPSPMSFKIGMDSQISTINKEEVFVQHPDALTVEGHVQKFRGVLHTATITKFLETVEVYEDENDSSPTILYNQHLGIYRIEFRSFPFDQHYQHSESGNSVEWYNGFVRLYMKGQENRPRKEYKVIRTENIGVPGQNLVVYILDPEFSEDNPNNGQNGQIIINQKHTVAYYPGYKVYLHADLAVGLTEEETLPVGDENEHYSIFGLRSHKTLPNLVSKISMPTLMFAKAIVEPIQPELPKGGKYATRPDFYGKSTFTFTTAFQHKPYSVQFNRASDVQFLNAIYNLDTVQTINETIFKNGEDAFYVNRWDDLLSFNYDDGLFNAYMIDEVEVRLPLPDSTRFLTSINAFIDAHNDFYNNLPDPVGYPEAITSLNQIIIPEVPGRNDALLLKDFVKDVIHNCFVPLTEIPVVYNYVKKESDGYIPISKKQVIRDRNGNLLPLNDPDFDMAPMMVRLTPDAVSIPPVTDNEIRFTDFGIDGASTAKYFYAVREFDLQMKTSEYSTILGPIRLVNTRPPTAPEILKVIPVLENRVLGITPKMQFEINPYNEIQNIKKVNIYRALSRIDSLSIRTMQLIKVIDTEEESLTELSRWLFSDDFSDLPEMPFGDPLFYCVTVSRQIKYIDKDGTTVIDYAPSEATKVVVTNIVENYSPESPVLQYYSEPLELGETDLNFITLSWNKTTYKGKYHLYKMNSQGNWVKIHELTSNEDTIYAQLEDTQLNDDSLRVLSDDGTKLYHHFKVIAENTSGMFSSKENILTIYNEVTWNDVGGIGTMIVGRTFRVR